MWTEEQIKLHMQAAKNLIEIKDLTFQYIKENKNISEYEVQQFILGKIKEFRMEIDKDPPIVAFDEDSATPEFYPKKASKKLKQDTFILIDLWAKLNKKDAPFADITWVAYYGKKVPDEIKRVFNIAIKARKNTLDYIKGYLKNNKSPPIGKDADNACARIISDEGYGSNILHYTGHSLGVFDDHGPEPNCLRKESTTALSINLGYTIEPGIYLKDKFGIRSEIDFYISKDNELIVTTDTQKEIIKI